MSAIAMTEKPTMGSGSEDVEKSGGRAGRVLARLRRDRPLPGKKHLYFMIFGMFMVMFIVGWNDASQGPLLPLLQEYYQVDYIVISLIWIAIAVGVVVAAVSNVFLADILGFGILAPLGAFSQMFSYVLMCWGGPYPLFVIAYLFAGLGMGWQDAQVNSLAARMPNATTVMFVLHAVYGFGATVSPFVATAFVQRVTSQFYLYFTISLALAAATVVSLIVIFQGRTENQIVGKRGATEVEAPNVPLPDPGAMMLGESEAASENHEGKDLPSPPLPAQKVDKPEEAERGGSKKIMAIITSPRACLLACYIFAYMGVEVTIGGWATTFLIDERGGNSSSGYVTSGFFGGLTVGRIVLIPVTNWLGHRRSVFIYTAIAIGLEFIVWFVPSLIGSATAISLVGVFLGPMYPSCVMIITEIMPHDLHTGTIGFIACFGIVGSAIMPFITGAIANSKGVWVLQPLMVGLLVLSLVVWFFVARAKPYKQ